jgi:hypothetical protein
MAVRLSIIVSILVAAIVSLIGGHLTIAKCFFGLSVLLIVEAIMFRRLLHFNIKLGNAKEAELIKADDPYTQELICVPVSLRFDLWEVKDIRLEVYSNDKHANSDLFNKRGDSLEEFNGTYVLNWRRRRGFASLAFLAGSRILIGNPAINICLPQNESYPVILKVWYDDTLITSSSYLITIIEGKMVLSDNNGS